FADRNVRSKKGSDQAPASSRHPPPAPAGGGPGRGATARTRGRQGPALKTVPSAAAHLVSPAGDAKCGRGDSGLAPPDLGFGAANPPCAPPDPECAGADAASPAAHLGPPGG